MFFGTQWFVWSHLTPNGRLKKKLPSLSQIFWTSSIKLALFSVKIFKDMIFICQKKQNLTQFCGRIFQHMSGFKMWIFHDDIYIGTIKNLLSPRPLMLSKMLKILA